MGRSRVTDDQLRAAAEHAQNLRQLLRTVGMVGRGGNYPAYRARLLRIGIDDARFQRQPRPPDPTERELREAAALSRSVAEVCRRLGRPMQGRQHRRVVEMLVQHGVDTSAFTGRAWSRGRRDLHRGRPLGQLLVRGSRISSTALRRRLLRDGLLEAVCAGCGGTTWQGQPIPLELDHVKGDRTDNRLENLRLLCPNCHALTDTYRGRNIGRRTVDGAPP